MKQGIVLAIAMGSLFSISAHATDAAPFYDKTSVDDLLLKLDTLPILPPGGSSGQSLIKKSDLNYDVGWGCQVGQQYNFDTSLCQTATTTSCDSTTSPLCGIVMSVWIGNDGQQHGLIVANMDNATGNTTCTGTWTLPTLAQLTTIYANRSVLESVFGLGPNANAGFQTSTSTTGMAYYNTQTTINGNRAYLDLTGGIVSALSTNTPTPTASNTYYRCVSTF